MVCPSLLVMNETGAAPQPGRLSAGTSFATIGGTLGISNSHAGCQVARVTALGRDLYATICRSGGFGFTEVTVYRYDPNTGSWATLGSWAPGTVADYPSNACGGAYALNGPTGSIVAGWGNAGFGSLVSWTYNPATGTFLASAVPGSAGGETPGRSIVWRNVIYAVGSTVIMAIDPLNISSTTYTVWGTGSTGRQGAFCVFRDRLFCLRHPAVGVATTLYELIAGTWTAIGTMDGAGTSTNANMLNTSNPVLFPVGNTKMVAIYLDRNGTSSGTRACDIIPSGLSFTYTDVTATLIPLALQPSVDPNKEDDFWTAFVDNDTDPTSPAVYLWHGTLYQTGTYSYYEYVNSASTLAPGTASVPTSYRLPGQVTGGGERINYDIANPDTDLEAVLVGVPAGILGGVRVSFRVAGGTNGSAGRRTDVNFATIAALPAYGVTGGPGPGSTLTASANGPLSVDGTSVVAMNRILVKDEGSPERNGIYDVTDAGSGGSPFILTRVTDFDQALAAEVAAGAWCRVLSGGSLANTYWQMSQTAAITMDTTALPWLQLQPRFIRIFYNNQYNTNQAQGTLFGTATGLPWVTRNGNVIEGVIADANTVYTLDWSIAAGPNSYVIRAGVS